MIAHQMTKANVLAIYSIFVHFNLQHFRRMLSDFTNKLIIFPYQFPDVLSDQLIKMAFQSPLAIGTPGSRVQTGQKQTNTSSNSC